MPYQLRKAPRRDAYWVINKQTGKKYSHEPLPYETAMKQMRVLYAQESGYKVNLKGGDIVKEEANKVADDLLLNLRLEYEANKQIEDAHNDGNFLVGGYAGTDDEVTPDYINLEDYRKTFGEALVSMLNNFFNGLGEFFKGLAQPFVDAFKKAINFLKSVGTIFGDIFTGNFERLKESGGAILTALDELTKVLPVANIVNAVGHMVGNIVQGKGISAEDFLSIMTAVGDTVSSLSTGGAGRLATSLAKEFGEGYVTTATRQQIKEAIETKIKDSIKEKLKSGLKNGFEGAVTKILLDKYLELHPDVPVYEFNSQITGRKRTVLLDPNAQATLNDDPENDFYIQPQQDIDTLMNRFAPEYGLNKNLDDPRLRKWYYKYHTGHHGWMVDDMVRLDNAKLSDDALEQLKPELDSYFLGDEFIANAIKNPKNWWERYIDEVDLLDGKYGFSELINKLNGENEYPSIAPMHPANTYPINITKGNPFDILPFTKFIPIDSSPYGVLTYKNVYVTLDRKKLLEYVFELEGKVKDKIKDTIKSEKDLSDTIKSDITTELRTLVTDITDEILQKVADSGGSITRAQYDALINSGISAVSTDVDSFVDDTIKSEFDKILDDGKVPTEEDRTAIEQQIKDGLKSLIHDKVIGIMIKQTPFGEDLTTTLNDAKDKLKAGINSFFNGQPTIKTSNFETLTQDDFFNRIVSGAFKTPDTLIKLVNDYRSAQTEVNTQIASASQKPDLNKFKESKINDVKSVTTTKYDLLKKKLEDSYATELANLKSRYDKQIAGIRINWNKGADGVNAMKNFKYTPPVEPTGWNNAGISLQAMTNLPLQTAMSIVKKYPKSVPELQKYLTDAGFDIKNFKGDYGIILLKIKQNNDSFYSKFPNGVPASDREEKLKAYLEDLFVKSKAYADIIAKENAEIDDLNEKYKKMYKANDEARDLEIKQQSDKVSANTTIPVKTLEQVKRELGILPPPPPPKPVLVQPPVVSIGKPVRKPVQIIQPPPPQPPMETKQQEKPVTSTMATTSKTQFGLLEKDVGKEGMELLSEQDRALREIKKYRDEQKTGLKEYVPAIVKSLKEFDIPETVVNRNVRVRQPKTKLFGKHGATVSTERRFGK